MGGLAITAGLIRSDTLCGSFDVSTVDRQAVRFGVRLVDAEEMIRLGWSLMSGPLSVVSLVLAMLSWAALAALPG
jgi:hypothetical protein